MQNTKLKKQKGFTLIDVLVGTSLVLIIFLGILGAYQLGMKVVGQSQNKISATAIATGFIEKIRNLPYGSVGIRGGFPDGVLEFSTTTIQNNIQYTIETRVDYVVDAADGIASSSLPADDCPNDYKRVEVKVSWSGRNSGQVTQVTDIAPKNLAQECATLGGILSVSVFDAYGVMIPSPLIEVKNPSTNENIKTATPAEGKHYFSLATSTYKIVVSKSGYSTDRTYGIDEIATPEKPHPLLIEGQLTEISLSIDKVSSFSIDTLSPWGSDYFFDSFLNESKILEKSNLEVSNGEITLATNTEGYVSSGYLISNDIVPANLVSWDKFSFLDSESVDTDLKYQIYFASGTSWMLIPDEDLPGNLTGLDISPVDLSSLSTSTYPKVRIKGILETLSTSTTPLLEEWQVSWINNSPVSIPNVAFKLRGDKIIGTDIDEEKVYKYSISTSTDNSGHKNLSDLEWDSYTFSIDPPTGLDLVAAEPSPQPISLPPNNNVSVKLYLDAQNSLLLTLQSSDTLEPIFAATVRAYNVGLGYDETQYTNTRGQTYFIPLEPASYNLEVSAPGYLATSTTVSVSGDKIKTIKLEQEE